MNKNCAVKRKITVLISIKSTALVDSLPPQINRVFQFCNDLIIPVYQRENQLIHVWYFSFPFIFVCVCV